MKISNYLLLAVAGLASFAAGAQSQAGIDSTGLPGDNFSLQGALALFKKASNPEEFEKLLNTESNHVNNLDLNEDGETDYVQVIDQSSKNEHAFILRVPVSSSEEQDIAVIELEKSGDNSAIIQIIGDEEIYGEQVIIEPTEDNDKTSYFQHLDAETSHGPDGGSGFANHRIIINVWYWPSVRFVFGTAYRPWISPWRWRHYPGWWKPWRPLRWHAFHSHHRHYHPRFAIVSTHRVVHAHRLYTPHRISSVTVRTRHASTVSGYRVNRSKTTVTGPRGHKAVKTRTTVTGPRGNKATRSKVRVR